MCGCKDCQGITLLSGNDGKGIVSVTSNGNGTFTYLYTDGTTYITPNLNGTNGTNGTNGATGATGATGPQGPAGVCTCVQVHYTTERLGPETIGTLPTLTSITGTSYTVPGGTATALYKLTYSAQIVFALTALVTGGSLNYKAYKNGVVIDSDTDKTATFYSTMVGNYIFGTSILLSNISLTAGDVIELKGGSINPVNIYLSAASFILEKIS